MPITYNKFPDRSINPKLSLEEIELIIMRFFPHIKKGDFQIKTRSRIILEGRHLCLYFSCIYTTVTNKEIGKYFGGYDHTTVTHACHKVMNLKDTNETYRDTLEQIDCALQDAISNKGVFVTIDDIRCLFSLDDHKLSMLRKFDLTAIEQCKKKDELDVYLKKSGLSLLSVKIYYLELTIHDFVKKMNMYDRSEYICYALKELFPDNYQTITEQMMAKTLYPGKKLAQIYEKMTIEKEMEGNLLKAS